MMRILQWVIIGNKRITFAEVLINISLIKKQENDERILV